MSVRLKNFQDVVANPALFFRREGQSARGTTIRRYQQKIRRRDSYEKQYCDDLEKKIMQSSGKSQRYADTSAVWPAGSCTTLPDQSEILVNA